MLQATDTQRSGAFVARHEIAVRRGDRVRVELSSSAFDTVLEARVPGGGSLSNDDAAGDRTRSELELDIPEDGTLKLGVTTFRVGAGGAYHLRVSRVTGPRTPVLARTTTQLAHHVVPNSALPTSVPGIPTPVAPTAPGTPPTATPATSTALHPGDRISGALEESDGRLPSGEVTDTFELDITAPQALSIELDSSEFDAYLVVTTPSGERLTNDDAGGSRNAALAIDAVPGRYIVIATTYRAGERGRYELKVLAGREAPAPASAETVQRGELREGDRQLRSGEFVDDHTITLTAGAPIHIEARSSAFDTYLIVRDPDGHQRDNDDQAPGNTNAALDFVAERAGDYSVLVTSYRPGETGAYELVTRSSSSAPAVTPTTPSTPPSTPTPTPGASPTAPPNGAAGTPPSGGPSTGLGTQRGTLAAGDRQLSSGEFIDTYPMTFSPGTPVELRVESSAFDSYLLVRSPSGRQMDNDDYRPGALHAGIDIPSAEAGAYQVGVTSYRSGETGAYTLTARAGSATAGPVTPVAPGTPPGAAPTLPAGAPRVFTISVGITDYPGSANDLPECANDARKIAEALRNQGLSTSDREFLLVDGDATTTRIREAFARVAAEAQPNDVFVFFYSGHGGQNTTHTDDRNELDGIDEYLFVTDGPLLDDELGRLVSSVRARTSLVALDACYSGGFAKDVVSRPGVIGLFSSEEDVTSAVASQFQAGGYLSHFLRLGIQGEADADPRDGALTVGELTHFVWQQYGQHASDVHMGEGYQQLVIDRGAVRNGEVLWRTR